MNCLILAAKDKLAWSLWIEGWSRHPGRLQRASCARGSARPENRVIRGQPCPVENTLAAEPYRYAASDEHIRAI